MEKDTKEKIKGCWLKIKIIQERCVVCAKLGGNKIIQNNACFSLKIDKNRRVSNELQGMHVLNAKDALAGCSYAKISTEY